MEQKIAALRTELTDIQKQLEDPSIFSSPKYPKIAKRQSLLENTIGLYDKQQELTKQLADARAMIAEGGELADLAALEETELAEALEKVAAELDEALMTNAM